MKTVTKKEMEQAAKDVRDIVNAARRRLFELETLHYIREMQEGKVSTYDSVDEFFSSLNGK